MEFDNDGKVILQTINQKIVHEEVYNNIPNIRYFPAKDKSIEYMWSYLQTHRFVSRNFLAGVLIDKFNPRKINQSNSKRTRHVYRRKISLFFAGLKELGLVSKFNTTTVRVHKKLNELSLDDVYKTINKIYRLISTNS